MPRGTGDPGTPSPPRDASGPAPTARPGRVRAEGRPRRASSPAPSASRTDSRTVSAPAGPDSGAREKIHLEILRRTGAYRTDDHFLLPSGHHAPEFIDKALVTTEPSFTEGLGDVIATHFAPWPADVVLSTGPGALILAHCVARALPSRPILVYATKGFTGQGRRVRLPDEFTRFVREGQQGPHRRGLDHDGRDDQAADPDGRRRPAARSSGSAASGSGRRRSTCGRTCSAW